ncbi:hypothetical protein B0H67DRAFT_355879 [Lasiosphaeris hirsuta]|uniref:Uncharacterized protein n=1 Tax=Lasiosphaeris hirsuta TaxID=260670 RepID=A0AA40DL16_9PEZI|nr:hypothetical protein B0H67DRAFT_355879 [Lasiosphaeris hirsuta]
MLRLTPSVISLTMAEVKELENRRLFQKYLELEEAYTPPGKAKARQLEIPSIQVDSSSPPSRKFVSPTNSEKRVMLSASNNHGPPSGTRSSSHSIVEHRIEERILPIPDYPRRRELHEPAAGEFSERGDPHVDAPGGTRLLSASPRRPARRPGNNNPGPASTPDSGRHSPPVSQFLTRRVSRHRHHNQGNEGHAIDRQRPGQSLGPDLTELLHRIDLVGPSPSPTGDAAASSDDTPREVTSDMRGPIAGQRETSQARPGVPRTPSRAAPSRSTSRTPGGFRIYDDSLPASSQPQTPQNLPEARHQSRLRGAYTVPTRRTSPLPASTPSTGRRIRWRFGGRHATRSPPGLREPGFVGLYGGIENTDDSVLFEQASRDMEPNETGSRQQSP